MKKIMSTLIVLLLLTTTFTGCGRTGLPEAFYESEYPQAEETAQYHPLVGRWVWDGDGYAYKFHSDGTGTRGFASQESPFEWETTEEGELLIRAGAVNESWSYSIEGEALTLRSRLIPGIVYSYTLAE